MDDSEYGKLFVGGLSWETSQDNLQRYFSRYGDVIDCVVMKNAESGRSRGFGFVTFSDPNNVSVVLQNGPHTLDGRTIDPKPCNPRTLQKPKKGGGYPKVFLGGLPSNVTETDLRTFFTRYGKVMEVVIMYDQEKKKSRGFGFLSFEDDDAVDRCVSEHFVNLNGKQVEIKKAEPRDGSGGSAKMSGADPGSAWGPPQAPMGMMQGPNGQMGGPPMNLGAPMGPNMMQGYQGWGTSPQQQSYAGYGTPSGPGSYQSWGAPAHQAPPPPQWGNNYGGPPQQQGYGSYGTGSGAANWNSWNMPQNNQNTGPSGYLAGTDMYSRQQAAQSSGGGPATPNTAANSTGANTVVGNSGKQPSLGGSDYGAASYGYGSYGGAATDGGGGYGGPPPRSYGSDAGSQVGAGAYSSQGQPNPAYLPPPHNKQQLFNNSQLNAIPLHHQFVPRVLDQQPSLKSLFTCPSRPSSSGTSTSSTSLNCLLPPFYPTRTNTTASISTIIDASSVLSQQQQQQQHHHYYHHLDVMGGFEMLRDNVLGGDHQQPQHHMQQQQQYSGGGGGGGVMSNGHHGSAGGDSYATRESGSSGGSGRQRATGGSSGGSYGGSSQYHPYRR